MTSVYQKAITELRPHKCSYISTGETTWKYICAHNQMDAIERFLTGEELDYPVGVIVDGDHFTVAEHTICRTR